MVITPGLEVLPAPEAAPGGSVPASAPRRRCRGLSRGRGGSELRGGGGERERERGRELPPASSVPPPIPSIPPLSGGAAGLPRSSSHGARPGGGTALLPCRQPLTGSGAGTEAGGQVGAGGAPEGSWRAGGQRRGLSLVTAHGGGLG